MKPEQKMAYVQFDNHESAERAFKSPAAVCGSRFIQARRGAPCFFASVPSPHLSRWLDFSPKARRRARATDRATGTNGRFPAQTCRSAGRPERRVSSPPSRVRL
jgi:hypothetical protein